MPREDDSISIREFAGLVSRPDALDIPPGSSVIQTNMQSSKVAELNSRPGYQLVIFEEE